MSITYHTDRRPTAAEIIALYDSAGLNRPTDDAARIAAMYAGSDVVVTAYAGDRLVGVSRSLTDWHWNCYLADLAVHADHQRRGIGRALIDRTHAVVGPRVMLHLIAAPAALDYYGKVDMRERPGCFVRDRRE